MERLGIFAIPADYKTVFYNEKFLLSSDEAENLTKKLRQIPMDTLFKGDDIPQSILPENLCGQSN